MNEDIFNKIVERLHKVASTKMRSIPINYDTEVYRDLRIYGDDLFELFGWIEQEFGVQIAATGERYGPSEMPFLWALTAFRKTLGRHDTKFKNLKVRDIVEAIEAKSQMT